MSRKWACLGCGHRKSQTGQPGPIRSRLGIERLARSGFLLLLGFVGFLFGCERDPQPSVRLVTTTSTYNSGLIDFVMPAFEESSGVRVHIIAVGTGQALEMGRRGDADIVLVHARDREDRFIEDGYGVQRRDVMWNDFVIVGPSSDPAGVAGLSQAPVALQRIMDSQSRFVSRGDDSGTHIKERALWPGNAQPAVSEWYLSAGQGMGRCLLLADQKQAYLLADRGTWLAYRDRIDLVVLVEGGQGLHNPYGALLVHPQRHPDGNHKEARQLLEFLVSDRGQELIGSFRLQGEVLFHPVAEGG